MSIRQYLRTAVKMAEMADERRKRLAAPLKPPACPPGWRTGPPDFVGVGVQKGGTTWWSRAVFAHPDILSPVRKELRFFQHHWDEEFTERRVVEYHRYFPRPDGGMATGGKLTEDMVTGGKITGEWTPNYMFDPWTAGRLHRAAPDARLLVILRDPVARLLSGLRDTAYHYYGDPHPRLVSEAIEFGRYGDQLQRLAANFPRSQILVLQLERCIQDPERELARTYEFIGVDPGFLPSDLREPVNESKGPPVAIPSDLVDVARLMYLDDARSLRCHWPEIDLELWPSMARSG
jgi:hypothetical protein